MIHAAIGAGAIDICTKTASSEFAVAITSASYAGTSAKPASDFVSVPSAVTEVRVVASGAGCATALAPYADLTGITLTAADYTVVVDGVHHTLVLDAADASAASIVAVDAVNATDVLGQLYSPVPAASLLELSAATAGSALPASFPAAFTGLALQTELGAGANTRFAKSVTAAPFPLGSRATIVVFGTAAGTTTADEAQVLICDHATTATCKVTPLTATPLAYLRFANMTDDSDDFTNINVCSAPDSDSPYVPTGVTALHNNQVSAWLAVEATNISLSFASGAVATNCGSAQSDSLTPAAGQLTTYVLSSATGGNQIYPANVAVVSSGLTQITTIDAQTTNNSVDVAVPALFGAIFAQGLTENGPSTIVTVPTASVLSANNRIFSVGEDPSSQNFHFAFPIVLPQPLDNSLSVFLAGTATKYAVICDDSSLAANGHALCAVAARQDPPNAYRAYVQLANFAGANVSLCVNGAAVDSATSGVADGTVTAFYYTTINQAVFGKPALGWVLSSDGDCAHATTVDYGSRSFSSSTIQYATVVASGTSAFLTDPLIQPASGNAFAIVIDLWTDLSFNAGVVSSDDLYSHAAGAIGDTTSSVVAGLSSVSEHFSVAQSAALVWAYPNLPLNQLTLPGSVHFAALLPPVGTNTGPRIVWCDDHVLDAGGRALCVSQDPTPP